MEKQEYPLKVGINEEGTYTPYNPPTPIPPSPEPDLPEEETEEPGNPLIIHHGAKQNQYLPVFINSIHPRAMMIEGTGADPRELAALSLGYVEHAINYAINEVVRMGAYRQRLSMTGENLTTANENTVSAKSTIADADMAKEMTGYTKANVLAQTAQSMISQANQNLGGVLDLLH